MQLLPHKSPVTYCIGFYTAAITFLIFDNELLCVLPFVYSITFTASIAFAAFVSFVVLLSLMFGYEILNEVLLVIEIK